MNAVLYCSYTGNALRIAEYFAEKTGYRLTNIETTDLRDFDTAVLVFPVHCQNLPAAVERFLGELRVRALAPIAVYGRMGHGDVLRQIQKHGFPVVAAAYVPAAHTYIDGDAPFTDFDKLAPIVEKTANPTEIVVPRARKNPFSDIFPAVRSRLGVKLTADASCDGCNRCAAVCSQNAIVKGKPNTRCIRCLRCVHACPRAALHFTCRLPMRLYLGKKKVDNLEIYI